MLLAYEWRDEAVPVEPTHKGSRPAVIDVHIFPI